MPAPLPKTPSHSALVGILWSVPRAGEKPTVRAAGSACWPFAPEGPARVNLDLILHAAHVAGCEVPDHFHFHAGQVFYHDDRPEEIRLAGVIPGESDTTGQPTFTPWGTPTLPTVTTGPNNTLILDPADAGRMHMSALVVARQTPDGQPFVAFLWDLRAHTPTQGIPASSLSPLPRHDHLTVMSTGHYQAVREALYKNTFQRIEGTPWPTAPLARGRARGQAQLRPVVVDDQPLMPPEEVDAWAQLMWRQREELSDLDADALDALSALWLYQARSPQDDAVADIDELLAMRGLKPKRSGQGRQGGYRPAQRTEMLKALSHVQNLWLNMAQVEAYKDDSTRTRRRKPTRQAIQSRAFVITDRLGQLRLDGWMDVQKFIFRPGKVFAHFLYGVGRQTALLSAKALAYDPYRQTWEKRLTRYLSWQWRTRAHAGNYMQSYRVDTLLEAIGQQVNPRRLAWQRERLEKALDTIREGRAIAAWQYESVDETHWPRSTIVIEPPDIIRDTYQCLDQHEASKPKALAAASTLAASIKRRRKELGLSQIQVAEQLEISQAYLSLLERGRKTKHRATLHKRLRVWLGES